MNIKKAVIPVAGFGTRFLSASKVVPKELFPVVDRPIIEIIVNELIECGIDEILLIIREGKESIINHFGINAKVEDYLANYGKYDILKNVKKTNLIDKIKVVMQKEPLGFANAISYAKDFVANQPFVLCTGDELILNETCSSVNQLINAYYNVNKSVIGLSFTESCELSNYGIVECEKNDIFFNIKDIVEKPINNPPSNYAINGKYIMQSDIFEIIDRHSKIKNSEILFTDCLLEQAKTGSVVGYEIEGVRCDTGDKFGFIKANIEYGLRCKTVSDKLKKYLKEVVNEI